MKFITFDAENTVSQRKGDACISFSRKSANSLSKAAAQRSGFGGGDLIAIHQDEENPNDWYVSLAKTGFELREKEGSPGLLFNSSAMSNTILDALEIEDDRAAFLIAGKHITVGKVNYWAILTAKPIIKKRKTVKK